MALGSLPPRWVRALVALGAAFLVATAGTVLVGSVLSTTAGYTVEVGPAVAEVPEGATVVDAEEFPAAVRERLAAAAEAGGEMRLLIEEFPVEALGERVYFAYGDSYYALAVTPDRALSAPGQVVLGLVYLLSLVVGVSLPARTRRWTT